MKMLSKVAIAVLFAAGLAACGGETPQISGQLDLTGKTGDITVKPGCLIFCEGE